MPLPVEVADAPELVADAVLLPEWDADALPEAEAEPDWLAAGEVADALALADDAVTLPEAEAAAKRGRRRQ